MNDTCEICGDEGVVEDNLCTECISFAERDYEIEIDKDEMDLVDIFGGEQ